MTLADKLKTLRAEHGYTMQYVADHVGVNKSTIKRWEDGFIGNMPLDKVSLIAEVFQVSPSYLMGWEDSEGNLVSNHVDIPMTGNLSYPTKVLTHRVRLISRIAAGEPIPTEDEWETVDAPAKADYALTIKGDSMSPDYMEDDIVYIRATDSVEDGSVAAVLLDDSATLKRVYHIPNGIQLVSLNPRYAPMVYIGQKDADTIRILGVPVGFTRMFK